MPRDGNGIYTLPASNPVVVGAPISATWANPSLQDIAQALTDSITDAPKDGQQYARKSATWTVVAPAGLFPDGTVAAPSIAFTSEPGLGIWRSGAGILGIAVGGVGRFNFSATGLNINGSIGVGNGIALLGGILTLPDGTAAAPSLAFGNEPSMGFYRKQANVYGVAFKGKEGFSYGAGAIAMTAPVGGENVLYSLVDKGSGGKMRWVMRLASGAESGTGNAGSDFFIQRFADDESFLGNSMVIYRGNGNVEFNTTALYVASKTSATLSMRGDNDNGSKAFDLYQYGHEAVITNKDVGAMRFFTNGVEFMRASNAATYFFTSPYIIPPTGSAALGLSAVAGQAAQINLTGNNSGHAFSIYQAGDSTNRLWASTNNGLFVHTGLSGGQVMWWTGDGIGGTWNSQVSLTVGVPGATEANVTVAATAGQYARMTVCGGGAVPLTGSVDLYQDPNGEGWLRNDNQTRSVNIMVASLNRFQVAPGSVTLGHTTGYFWTLDANGRMNATLNPASADAIKTTGWWTSGSQYFTNLSIMNPNWALCVFKAIHVSPNWAGHMWVGNGTGEIDFVHSGGGAYGNINAGVFNVSSDESLKVGVAPLLLASVHGALMALQPITWTWPDPVPSADFPDAPMYPDTRQRWGFSAQQLEQAMPLAVTSNGKHLFYDPVHILAATVAEVQDLVRRIAALEVLP